MRVFIDTNIYLSFISLSTEKLESLKELKKLIDDGKISLIFPLITQEELSRRIPRVTQDHIDTLSEHLPLLKAPKLAASVSEGKSIKKIKTWHKAYTFHIRCRIALHIGI